MIHRIRCNLIQLYFLGLDNFTRGVTYYSLYSPYNKVIGCSNILEVYTDRNICILSLFIGSITMEQKFCKCFCHIACFRSNKHYIQYTVYNRWKALSLSIYFKTWAIGTFWLNLIRSYDGTDITFTIFYLSVTEGQI